MFDLEENLQQPWMCVINKLILIKLFLTITEPLFQYGKVPDVETVS